MREKRRGFTLLEVVIIVAIISIIASVAVPYAYKMINQQRRSSTMEEMEALYTALYGDPSRGTGGYVGDMGILPPGNDLRALTQRRYDGVTQPAGTTDTYGVRYGWFGPYINSGFDQDSFRKDEWGVFYRFGDPGQGQIRSAGEDGLFGTQDDIIYPPQPVTITGSLLVNVYAWDGSRYVQNPTTTAYPAMSLTVSVYYSSGGVRNAVSLGSPADPPYTFLNLHQGQHAVVGSCDLDGAGPLPASTGVLVTFVKGENSQTICDLYLR
ncbi:MAG: prepilin-type N-terminal cleavage/methylation domain-containing protein [Deltaproteobacteria bacterium]|nr:MAG: prepilin-type N-terminal cleavage/methylation domain-containing protein [Deltaproteobacteria bacterium]